ncbi:inactive serine protease scarface isoform X1 [Drosophila takahashii]|uniref:inactive serine protease scarface isoform X1 n=2 Tax=Drosophila takahashii TaxID=29030 RepID=UPI0007E86045|nr:inactive serine protease scarface [Drosophila takahashii]XP_017003312.1 inactive serine protease scarface [Drosophila takahashii]
MANLRFQEHLALCLTLVVLALVSADYQGNMFLNGQYQNSIKDHKETHLSVNPSSNVFLSHAIISRQASPFQGPTYLPPKQYLKCDPGQQCVRLGQCLNGFFTNKFPRIQNCEPETDICCTYKAPPTTTTASPVPFASCPRDSDCVAPENCRNGEISAINYVKKQGSTRCSAPDVCCRMPSTTLTENGYIFNLPNKTFPLPTNPTIPAVRTTPPAYRTQPTTMVPAPRPTNEYLPPSTTRRSEHTTRRPVYLPPPTTQKPQPRPQPSRSPNNEYLPPISANEIPKFEPDRVPQPSNEKPIYRGEDQLSPQIFPSSQPNVPKHFAKCASALVCTSENFCNAIGVLSESAVELTPLEAAFRVPLTDCLQDENGAPGKCCRDPNYVDPWPVNLAGVCATRNKRTKPTGVKDLDANFAEISWQAMILRESSKTLICGGAIIGDEFILTSASCVNGLPVTDIRVKAGEWELGSTNEPLPFQLTGVKSIDVHPAYDPSTNTHDIAIIRLERRLEFATHIQPICISDEDPKASEQCITSGWGKQALSIHEEGALMHVTDTSVLVRSECGADTSSVCSATKFDACQFDVGSALACGSGSNVRLKGIFAGENSCGDGQAVRFAKPDIKWINTAFADRNKPLLLKRF